MRASLNQTQINALQPGPRQVIKLEGTPGLHIIIGPRKVSYYRVHKVDKKVRWVPLAIAAPEDDPNRISLKEAQNICHGAPPKTSVKKSRRGSSLYTVSKYYSEVFLPIHKKEFPRSWFNLDGAMRRHVLGLDSKGRELKGKPVFEARPGVRLADLRLDSVHHDMIVKLHSWVGEGRGRPVAANAMIRRLRQMFAHALRREAYRGVNPVSCLPNGAEEKIALYHEPERDRFVDEDEMPHLLAAIDAEIDEDWRDFFRLLLYTGQRKSTVMAMRWDQIHGDRWVIENNYRRYQTRTKNKDNFSVRLLPEAVDLLKARKERLLADVPAKLKASPWVFPSKDGRGGTQKADGKLGPFIAPRIEGGKKHITDARKAHARICGRVEESRELPPGTFDLTIHDYRRTLASWLVAKGAPDPVIADVLGHRNVGSVKRYARLRKGGDTTMKYARAALGAMLNRQEPKKLENAGSAGREFTEVEGEVVEAED